MPPAKPAAAATAAAAAAGPLAPLRAFSANVSTNLRAAQTDLTQAALARLATLLLLHPLDAAKTRLQVTSAHSRAAIRAATRGPWFKGAAPAALGHVPYGVLTFGLFGALRARIAERRPRWHPRATALAAALCADVLGALWLVPLETAKLRLQAGLSPNVLAAVRSGGLWAGLPSQVLRDAPFRALHVVSYDAARARCAARARRDLSPPETVGLGAAVGAFVGGVTTPLDVLKTRVMSQRVGPGRAYSSWLACLNKTLRADGVCGLFRGVLPRIVYMGASVALFSVAYEASRRFVEEEKLARTPNRTATRRTT